MRNKLENLITRDCHCFLQQWDMVWASERCGESAVFFLGTGKTEKNSAKNLSTKGLCSQTDIWKCSELHLLRAAFLSLKFSLLLQQPAIAQKQMTWIPTPWNFPSQPNTTVWSLESYNCPHNNPSIACNNNLWCPQILKCFASCAVCTWTNDWWSRIFGSTLQATPPHPWSYDLCARVVVVLGLGSKAFPDLRELLLNCAICSCEKITLGSLVCSWVWSRVVKISWYEIPVQLWVEFALLQLQVLCCVQPFLVAKSHPYQPGAAFLQTAVAFYTLQMQKPEVMWLPPVQVSPKRSLIQSSMSLIFHAHVMMMMMMMQLIHYWVMVLGHWRVPIPGGPTGEKVMVQEPDPTKQSLPDSLQHKCWVSSSHCWW